LHLGGQTAGLGGLLTLLAKGHRPDVVAYSGDVELWTIANQLGMQTSMNFTEYATARPVTVTITNPTSNDTYDTGANSISIGGTATTTSGTISKVTW
jgi:hypothetical protein